MEDDYTYIPILREEYMAEAMQRALEAFLVAFSAVEKEQERQWENRQEIIITLIY